MNDSAQHPILELVDVSAARHSARGPVRVVDRLSLSVEPGELVALMGPSGSGKTSVLHLAAGLLAPTSGTIDVAGVDMTQAARSSWATVRRRRIGIVHQRLDLLDGLDVLDNVALPMLLDGRKLHAAHDAARSALEQLGVAALASARPDELSVGQQQLVAVARAVVGGRRLVLADEPTAALDTVAAERVVEVLTNLAERGTAIIMATHDTRLAGWADRVEYLRDGALLRDAQGEPVSSAGGAR